jgi:hypothetical protein
MLKIPNDGSKCT